MKGEQTVNFLKQLGPHAFWVYVTLLEVSDDNNTVEMPQQKLADLLGISTTSLWRHINTLTKFSVDANTRLVSVRKQMDYNIYTVYPLLQICNVSSIYISSITLEDNKDKDIETLQKCNVVKKDTPFMEVWNYWLAKYQETYGVSYKSQNYSRDRGQMKRLLQRYGEDVERLKAIFDVIFRLYDSRWKTNKFLRPTIGQALSWLAVQAEAFITPVEAVDDGPSRDEETHDDEDIFSMLNKKWGDPEHE